MKSQSNTRPDWRQFISGPVWRTIFEQPAVRRTFENAIMQAWKCDREEAAREFDRALSRGELEPIKIGLSVGLTAYKLKI